MAEENENEEVEEEEEEKGSALKFIVIGVVVLVLAVGGFLAWQMLGSGGAEEELGGALPAVDQAIDAGDTETQTYSMETFVVNLNDPGGKRYLKTNIELEYVSEELGEELTRRLPQLRDQILLQLSSKSLDDIQTVEGKINLRRELIQRVNQTLTTGKIRNLYFTQFVVQ